MKPLFVLLLIVYSSQTFSQILTEIIDPNISNQKLLWNTTNKNTIKGSPYLFDTWKKGVVKSFGSDREFLEINIDLINGIPVIRENDKIIGLNASMINSIVVSNNEIEETYYKAVNPETGLFIFPKIIFKGDKYWLLVSKQKSLANAKTQTGYESSYNPMQVLMVKEKSTYYLKNGDEIIPMVKKYINSYHQNIGVLMKQEKLSWKKTESFIKLINALEN